MKNFKIPNKYILMCIGLLLAVGFLIFGKGDHSGVATATAALVLTAEEKADFNDGEQKMLLAVKKMIAGVDDKIKSGKLTAEEVSAFKDGVIETLKNSEIKALKDELEGLKEKAKKQGISLTEMELKLTQGGGVMKSIGKVLQDDMADIQKVYENGSGVKTYMVTQNEKGQWVMVPKSLTKAAGPHATIDGIGGGTAAITQSIDAATLLRLGGGSPIISNYRNTAWIFDLVNVINSGFDMPFAMWYEEQAKQGGSDTVLEGGTKPKTQYAYALKTATYKKEATLIGFTDEFTLDFARLQDDIMNKGRIDLINSINSKLLTNITSNATAYSTGASFNGGVPIVSPNDYHALAALAAEVDNATFGALANSAIMSTFKKYRMGTLLSTSGEWLDRPSVLDNLAFIGNPDVGTDNVIVGDLKAYNVILRGGFIVKVGYNGTDFAENKFSVVMEQYYYDYISTIRKKAIVKGADFATVKAALAV